MPSVESGSVLAAVVTAAAAYFIGGIPFGIVVARLVGGRDPRSIGSGRTGGANTLRAIGPRWALVSGLLDAAKGSVAVLIPRVLGFGPEFEVLGALVAIVGHSRSPYIGFGGGRGVSVAWGTLVVIQPLVALAILPVFGGRDPRDQDLVARLVARLALRGPADDRARGAARAAAGL